MANEICQDYLAVSVATALMHSRCMEMDQSVIDQIVKAVLVALDARDAEALRRRYGMPKGDTHA